MRCSRLDLFQTGATSTPKLAGLHECGELRLALVGESVADAHAEFWKLHIEFLVLPLTETNLRIRSDARSDARLPS